MKLEKFQALQMDKGKAPQMDLWALQKADSAPAGSVVAVLGRGHACTCLRQSDYTVNTRAISQYRTSII